MADTHKRPGGVYAGEAFVKKLRTPVEEEETDYCVGDDIVGYFSLYENETVDDLMNLLEPEKNTELNLAGEVNQVRFIENPYSSPMMYRSYSLSYITINLNEESCGSSFSVCNSSMMASIYMSGLTISEEEQQLDMEALEKWAEGFAVEEGSACASSDDTAREEGSVSGEGILDGCDGFDWDDVVLARFLGE
ncbi:Protein SON like [Quillaja saponaria]|uniref:Protein SON like n=1 Tax=Quillaja saponaria TaxID=32244 RepID=A0AAD7QD86_QUISA|nr:Protein SON like [Quillaja saponaria]